MNSLHELFVHELKDLWSAEGQLVKALPKMAKAASSEKLRMAFEEHFEVTQQQLERLEEIFEELGASPRGKKCEAMAGLIAEGQEVTKLKKSETEPSIKDAALIAAAQKVEHYEIAGYGTVRTYARLLGMDDAAELLQQTLDEESETDEALNELAESEINEQALHVAETDD